MEKRNICLLSFSLFKTVGWLLEWDNSMLQINQDVNAFEINPPMVEIKGILV